MADLDKEHPDAEHEHAKDHEGSDDASEAGEAQAKRIADALGVGEDDAEGGSPEGVAAGEAETEEEAAAPNRAARRRDEARKRRKKSASTAVAATAEGEDTPKDRNKRAKDLLSKRREQAAGGSRAVALLPSEMVDDAFTRSSAAAGKWFRANFAVIQWVIVVGLVGAAGYSIYTWRTDSTSAAASDDLFAGISAERGVVMAEDKRPDEQKEVDPQRVFKTADERDKTALASYKKVAEAHPNSGPAILGKLGEAGVYLDKREWDKAIELYNAVIATKLAGADADVKGRALEGLGLAKEGKADTEGALAAFSQMETLDARGFKELSWYHQGRVLLKKGDKEKAKELLKKAHDALHAPSTEGKPLQFLQTVVDETLREIDPTLAPISKGGPIGGAKGNTLSADELKNLQRRIEEMAKKKSGDHDH